MSEVPDNIKEIAQEKVAERYGTEGSNAPITVVYVHPAVTAGVIALAIIVLFIHFSGASAARVSCASFKSQVDAQAHYSRSLDRNGDGKACTSYNYSK